MDDRGFYEKFKVVRVEDGKDHDGCQYFTVDITHDPLALAALKAYADACVATKPALAADLYEIIRRKKDVPVSG